VQIPRRDSSHPTQALDGHRDVRVGGGPVAQLAVLLSPQHSTVIVVSSAQVCSYPTATAVTPLRPLTATGVV